MYFFVKFEGIVKVASNITIDDDCCPVVDGKAISDRPAPKLSESAVANRASIDAVSWFKSLPIEAVYVDCSARDARWCLKSAKVRECKSPTLEPTPVSVNLRMKPGKHKKHVITLTPSDEEHPFMPESARPLFSGHPGVLDFNPVIDEMFEHSEVLVRSWDGLVGQGQLRTEVAKILHSYVFPAVLFKKEDAPVLQECLRLITLKQQNIEKEIMEMDKSIGLTEKYFTKQKEAILNIEDMVTQSYLQACETEFVKTFYIHVTKDYQRKNMKLDNIQLKINDLKKGEQDNEGLEKLIKDRDALHKMVSKLIIVREAIRNYLYRPFIRKKKRGKKFKISKGDNSLHSAFQTAHLLLVEHKDQMKRLCYRKLHTLSIKEAIETTIRMVQQENPRALGDFSEFSVYLGSGAGRKQWQSMQAMVDEWLGTDGSLFRSHKDGCQLVRDLAEGILSDSLIASIGMEKCKGPVENSPFAMEMTTKKTTSGATAHLTGVTTEPDPSDDLLGRRAPMVKVMTKQVLVHTWEVAEQIVNWMNFQISPGGRHINRAWVCYSPHFWKEAGKSVEEIYRHFHTAQARLVFHKVSSVPLSDLMDSSLFHEVFLQAIARASSSSVDGAANDSNILARMQSLDSASAVSLDLLRCSLTDLYARVNRDGAKVNCQMMELEAIRCSFMSTGSHSSFENADLNGMCFGTSNEISGFAECVDANTCAAEEPPKSSSSASDSGDSVHSEDLFDSEDSNSSARNFKADTDCSNETVVSLMTLFENVVGPYHELVQKVLGAPDIMEKLRAVWKSVDFLCQKAGEICKQRGMDSLLPFSIFAISSFPEEMFVSYYIQLLILSDLKPPFVSHSMYDFSLTNAISSYVYLFEAQLPSTVPNSDESDT